ncbi:hypothetical protein [Ralstonia soli]|uniref:Uncharacterized protein n=1 Tax=Ralstonia soli TaxID=2953896 RepID=A0ABT1APA6_9RALS|nr:hypothetical protein [Ralstonia soli]MCO5399927.1 hypothetical protein [Ralstonia soli]
MQARKMSSLAAAIAVATCAWIGAAPAHAQQQKDHSAVTGVDSPMEGPRTQVQRDADAAENPGYHNKMAGAQPRATPGTLKQKVHRAHVKTDKWVDKHVTHRKGNATAESSSDRAFWSRRANQCDSLVGEAQRVCRDRRSEAVNGQ